VMIRTACVCQCAGRIRSLRDHGQSSTSNSPSGKSRRVSGPRTGAKPAGCSGAGRAPLRGAAAGTPRNKARAAHDTQLLAQLEEAGKAIAEFDEQVRVLTTQINFARALTTAREIRRSMLCSRNSTKRAGNTPPRIAGSSTSRARQLHEAASAARIQSILRPRQHCSCTPSATAT